MLRIFEPDLESVDAKWRGLYTADEHGVGFVLNCDHELLVKGLKSALAAERSNRRLAEMRLKGSTTR